jgi:hypothetical protein
MAVSEVVVLLSAVADNGRGLPDQQRVVVMHHRVKIAAVAHAPKLVAVLAGLTAPAPCTK